MTTHRKVPRVPQLVQVTPDHTVEEKINALIGWAHGVDKALRERHRFDERISQDARDAPLDDHTHTDHQTGETYTVTNGTTDRTYDADATNVAELADVLATVIADLQGVSILS